MRTLAWLARVCVVSATAGCTLVPSNEHESRGVVGSALDAKVAAGTYEGFRVVRPCPAHVALGAPLAVQGTGPKKLATQAELGAWANSRLAPLTRAGMSVHTSGGIGLGCEARIGTRVSLYDWREVDGLVAKLGAFMVEDGVDVEVSIDVSGVPHAL